LAGGNRDKTVLRSDYRQKAAMRSATMPIICYLLLVFGRVQSVRSGKEEECQKPLAQPHHVSSAGWS